MQAIIHNMTSQRKGKNSFPDVGNRGVMRQHPTMSTRIKFLRDQREWSQTDLAEHAGVSQPTIYRAEKAAMQASLKTLRKIAAAFGVGLQDLFKPGSEDAFITEVREISAGMTPADRREMLHFVRTWKNAKASAPEPSDE